jgi:tetratricopeptide (TPR) repeat protein
MIFKVSILRILAIFVVVALLTATEAMASELPTFDLTDVASPVREAIEQASAEVRDAQSADSEEQAAAWGRLGDVALAHQFSDQARVAYQQAIAKGGENVQWHYLLGMLELSDGRLAQAIEAFNQALDKRADAVLVRLRRGQALLDAGDLPAAEQDFQRVLESEPDNAAALGGLGRVALQQRQFEQAIAFLDRALGLNPAADRLHYLLGQAYRGAGQLEQARYHLERRGDTEEVVEDPWMLQVQQSSRNPQFYLEMGLQRADLGDFDAAAFLLGRAAQLAPDEPRILTNFGEVLARNGQLEQAYAVFRRLAQLQPNESQTHFYIGQIEELRGNYASAASAYRHLIGMVPDDPQARAALAWALLAQGLHDEARERFEQAVQLTEQAAERAKFVYWQGMTWLSAGDCEAAVAAFQQAREMAEQPPADLLSALSRAWASCFSASDAQLQQALRWAEAIYQAQPGLRSAESLAMVYARLGRFEDAIDLQAQAMFEALKQGGLEQRPWLQANMQRYRDSQPAPQPFAPEDPVFTNSIGG